MWRMRSLCVLPITRTSHWQNRCVHVFNKIILESVEYWNLLRKFFANYIWIGQLSNTVWIWNELEVDQYFQWLFEAARGRREWTLLIFLSALTDLLLCPHKIWARCWVQGLLVVVVGWREGRHRKGVYGACNPCPWGLHWTGGASMELISNSMELWKSENTTKDFFGQLVFNVTKHTLPPAAKRQLQKFNQDWWWRAMMAVMDQGRWLWCN